MAEVFGAQCVVLAIDAKRRPDGGWEVYVAGGRTPVGRDAVMWAKEGVERGAGEILLTSMDRDGVQTGYDTELLTAISSAVDVPVIASGRAGEAWHVADALKIAQAALLASILHEDPSRLVRLREELRDLGIPLRDAA